MSRRKLKCCMVRITLLLVATQAITSAAWCQNSETTSQWHRFRGPNGSGVCLTTKAPIQWANDKNIRWKLALDGFGRSSPVVVDDRVFLTSHSAKATTKQGFSKHLLCIDLQSGDLIWKKTIVRSHAQSGEKHQRQMHSGFAPHTVATDGRRVFAYFGTDGLFSFDFDGQQIWHFPVGDGEGNYGTGSSPIVYKNVVIQNAGVESGSLLAIYKETGKQAWAVSDDALKSTLSTPVVATMANGDELVVQMNGKIVGFNPLTGNELWRFSHTATQHAQIASPVVFDNFVCSSPSYSNELIAIPLGERGNLHAKELWKTNGRSFMVSPLIVDARIHQFGGKRSTTAYIAKNGEKLGQKRVAIGRGAQFHASPVRLGDHWMIVASDGQSFVWPVNQNSSAEPIVNKLQEEDPYFVATPAVTENEILIRSDHFLYCISAPPTNSRAIALNDNIVIGTDKAKQSQVGKIAKDKESQRQLKAKREQGKDYLIGRNGVNRDKVKAGELLRLAAEQGDAEAQYYFGSLFFMNKNLDQSVGMAWMKKSASNGFWKAQEQLKEWDVSWEK